MCVKHETEFALAPPPGGGGVNAAAGSPGRRPRSPAALIVVYPTSEPLFGRRFPLDEAVNLLDIGGPDAVGRCDWDEELGHYVVHARASVELNDNPVPMTASLRAGDRIRVGRTILRFIAGADMEAQYHETIQDLVVSDPLTGLANARRIDELTRHPRWAGARMLHLRTPEDDDHREPRIREIADILRRVASEEDELLGRTSKNELVILIPRDLGNERLDEWRTLGERLGLEVDEYRSNAELGVRVVTTAPTD